MSMSENLCKNMYASTLMEYIFNNHTNYSANIFVNDKLEFLLGKFVFNNILLIYIYNFNINRHNRRCLW